MLANDTRVDMDVDLNKEVPCESVRDDNGNIIRPTAGCTRPAEWMTTHTCCGHQRAICDHHRQAGIKRRADNIRDGVPMYCGACNAWRVNITHRPI